MKLSELKQHLSALDQVAFQLSDGSFVPEHFHVTEVGVVTRHFIDCGGTVRNEAVANLQLWNADDYEHRLKPEKLLHILQLAEEKLGMGNYDIEVEYQGATIGKYGLGFNGSHFTLDNKTTACLAQDACGIPGAQKKKVNLADLKTTACCGGGSC
jgi:hypothetical protein